MLETIQSALKLFSNGNLTENALNLFQKLGYESERQMAFEDKSFVDFEEYITDDSKFSEKNAFVEEWQYVDLLFQITESELSEQFSMFDKREIEKEQFNSYLFFALELNEKKLNGKEFTRTDLANITREINKCFPMPVFVLFKLGSFLTFSVINRRLHKKDETKDVIEIKKVSLIKDIDFQNPKRSHLEILKDLSLEELQKKHKFQNFVELHKAWMATLDTKELNKRFFRELSNWYFWAVSQVAFPRDANDEDSEETHSAKSVIRLITRLMFVWFLKEKGLIGNELFNKRELDGILKSFASVQSPRFSVPKPASEARRAQTEVWTLNSSYYKAILQNLFFATLNTDGEDPKTPRKFRNDSDGSWYKGNLGIANVFRYKSEFRNPDETLEKYFLKIPFLNGGLFECLDKPEEKIYVDGFSERKDNVLSVPDELFFSEESIVDLSEVYNDSKKSNEKVRGLIRILDNYKFTIAENTPIEEEIALDPELLGKVFENLLANYNPETRTTARKQTGSFYTPREIVNYMVDESLIAYLKAKLEVQSPNFSLPATAKRGAEHAEAWTLNDALEYALRDLFSYAETNHHFNDDEINIIIKAINDCKILDPACGSGAFPMGILQRLVFLLGKLDKDNVKWRELQKQEALRQIETAYDELKDKDERQKRLDEIDEVFDLNSSDYGRKLFLIENCIYGVDIQPVAIQISKLRFFISLIIDQKVQSSNFSLQPAGEARREHAEAWTLNNNRGVRPLPNLETKLVAANTLLGLEAQAMLKPSEVNNLEKELKQVRSKIFRARTPSTKLKWRNEDKRIRHEIADLLKQTGYAPDAADKIANWSPDNQDAHADWFDKEWMFGIEKGFDIVIGNPPYVQVPKGLFSTTQFPYSEAKDKGKQNLYKVFVENSYNLSKPNGIASMIVQSSLMCDISAQFTRQLLLTKTKLSKVIEFPKVAPTKEGQVFESVLQGTCVYIFRKATPSKQQNFDLSINNDVTTVSKMRFDNLNQSNLMTIYPNGFFIPLVQPKDFNLAQKVFNKSLLLENKISKIKKGDISSDGGKNLFNGVSNGFRLIRGNNIQRFNVKLPFDRVAINASTKLLANQNSAESIIAFQNITGTVDKHRIHCTIFEYEEDLIFLDTTIKVFLKSDENAKFLLGVLNCRISDWYFRKTSTNNHVNGYEIEQLPIPKATDAQQTEIAEIVDEIIKAKKRDAKADTKKLECKIDKLVYRLYDLTDEEIAIVEGKSLESKL